jgi:hypothetical protein
VFAIFASVGISMPIEPHRHSSPHDLQHHKRSDLSDFVPVLIPSIGGVLAWGIMCTGMHMIAKAADQKINFLSNEKKQLQLNRNKAIKEAM